MRNYLKLGDWNAICDVCGFKHKASQLRKRWDGLMVCSKDFELRHPQDFLRVPHDDPSVAWARPEPTPIYVGPQLVSFVAGSTTIATSSNNFPQVIYQGYCAEDITPPAAATVNITSATDSNRYGASSVVTGFHSTGQGTLNSGYNPLFTGATLTSVLKNTSNNLFYIGITGSAATLPFSTISKVQFIDKDAVTQTFLSSGATSFISSGSGATPNWRGWTWSSGSDSYFTAASSYDISIWPDWFYDELGSLSSDAPIYSDNTQDYYLDLFWADATLNATGARVTSQVMLGIRGTVSRPSDSLFECAVVQDEQNRVHSFQMYPLSGSPTATVRNYGTLGKVWNWDYWNDQTNRFAFPMFNAGETYTLNLIRS